MLHRICFIEYKFFFTSIFFCPFIILTKSFVSFISLSIEMVIICYHISFLLYHNYLHLFLHFFILHISVSACISFVQKNEVMHIHVCSSCIIASSYNSVLSIQKSFLMVPSEDWFLFFLLSICIWVLILVLLLELFWAGQPKNKNKNNNSK